MKLFVEKWFPYALAAIACGLWWRLSATFPTDDGLLSATLAVSGILVGFLSTSKAILLSMTSPIIEELKSSGYMQELVSYIGQAIWANLLFCLVCVIGYFVDTSNQSFSMSWVGIGVASAAAFVRVTHIMLKILKHS